MGKDPPEAYEELREGIASIPLHQPPTANRYPPTASQLRWRCRRGMRELDVLLERYVQQRYPSAPAAEQHAFEALLDLPDPRLLALIMRREIPADPEWAHVIARLTDPHR